MQYELELEHAALQRERDEGVVGDDDGVDVGEHEIALESFIEGAKDVLGSEMNELEHLDQL